METNKVVRFLARAGVYNVGEIAGFPTAKADAYIEAGIAEAYTPPPPVAPPENPDDPRHDITAFSRGADRGRGRRT